jgi:DNA-binding IclR family transcriptional regulator
MPRTTASHEASPAPGSTPAAAGNYHTHALTRGLSLLDLFTAHQPPLTLTDIHQESNLPKSTLVRLLSALVTAGFITKVDERPAYRLGHKLLDLADHYVASLDIAQLAGGYLDTLSALTRQTSNIGVLDADEVLHVCVRTPVRSLRFEQAPGSRGPAYCTALGKVLLSGLDATQVRAHLGAEPFTRLTDRTLTGYVQLDGELVRTRRRGYALDDNEHSVGLRCLAVPLRHSGQAIAALSVSGPSGEFGPKDQQRYLDALKDAADRLVADPDVVASLRRISSMLRPTAGDPV